MRVFFLLAVLLAPLPPEAVGKGDAGLPPGIALQENLVYGKAGGRDLKLDLLKPKEAKGPLPVVLWVHGGGWRAGRKEDHRDQLAALVGQGFACASVEYRLTQEAPFPAQIQDCKCAVRFLRAKATELGLDPERIGVWGFSAGGHLAALLGTSGGEAGFEGQGGWAERSSRVAAVCVWSGIGDVAALCAMDLSERDQGTLTAFLGGKPSERAEEARRASPVAYATKDDPPTLVAHGVKDPRVPVDQARALVDTLRKAGVEVAYHELPDAGHGTGFEKELAEVQAFFVARLKPPR